MVLLERVAQQGKESTTANKGSFLLDDIIIGLLL